MKNRGMRAFDPPPPLQRSWLPAVGSGLALLRDPVAYLTRCRARHGDTFALRALGYDLLFLFSPLGVANLWAAPEAELSKGLADYALLSHKVPAELFAGRRTLPHQLFSGDDVRHYLRQLEQAIDSELDRLGSSGEVELFALTRRLGHRVGLACWGGIDSEDAFAAAAAALDRLDSAESFVRPHRGLWTHLTRKRAERRALRQLEEIYSEIVARRTAGRDDLFDRICAAWRDEPSPKREIGVARDAVLVHMASMSNLYAAAAWTIVHVLDDGELSAAAAAGDRDRIEQCALESIRLHQRSIVLRRAVAEATIADETASYRLAPGAFVATMLPLTNTTSASELDRFEPSNYVNRRFARVPELAEKSLVTTFGHGLHTCPAMHFSLETIIRFTHGLLSRFAIEPRFDTPRPLRHQIGGIARADRPCRARYQRRA